MDEQTRVEVRQAAGRTRRPPGKPTCIRFAAMGKGELPTDAESGSLELMLEVTEPDGQLAVWFDDEWWAEVIARWANLPVTIHITATPSALLHPVTLHHLEMLQRVVPRWRKVGHAYPSEITSTDDVETLAKSLFDEVRFIDAPSPHTPPSDRRLPKPGIEELFGNIRRAQARLDKTRPILVRIPGPGPAHERSRATDAVPGLMAASE